MESRTDTKRKQSETENAKPKATLTNDPTKTAEQSQKTTESTDEGKQDSGGFDIKIKKLEVPVRPRGVLAE